MTKVKTKVKNKTRSVPRKGNKQELKQSDSSYFLKLLLYFILGTLWVRLVDIDIGPFQHFSLPAGLLVGVWLASREKFQIDRKIEYAILIGATFASFYLPVGITL